MSLSLVENVEFMTSTIGRCLGYLTIVIFFEGNSIMSY